MRSLCVLVCAMFQHQLLEQGSVRLAGVVDPVASLGAATLTAGRWRTRAPLVCRIKMGYASPRSVPVSAFFHRSFLDR